MPRRDAAAWGAVGIVVAAGLAPLLVPGSALQMALGMVGLILFLLAHGSLTYGRRGALGFFACAYPVAFALEALAIATGSPSGTSPTTAPAWGSSAFRPRCRSSTRSRVTWRGRSPGW